MKTFKVKEQFLVTVWTKVRANSEDGELIDEKHVNTLWETLCEV